MLSYYIISIHLTTRNESNNVGGEVTRTEGAAGESDRNSLCLVPKILEKRNDAEPELSSTWLMLLSTQLRRYSISFLKICWYKAEAFPGTPCIVAQTL